MTFNPFSAGLLSDQPFIVFHISFFYFSVDQPESQRTKEQTIDNLDPLIWLKICKKLDIEDYFGGDYRELAARFGMPIDDIDLISQRTNQTQKVLRWIARNPQNNIDKLKDVLRDMERLDCVRIIEKPPKSGTVDYATSLFLFSFKIPKMCTNPNLKPYPNLWVYTHFLGS